MAVISIIVLVLSLRVLVIRGAYRCDLSCDENARCLVNRCACNPGYQSAIPALPSDKFQCKPICEESCTHGTCIAPNRCECHEPYVPVEGLGCALTDAAPGSMNSIALNNLGGMNEEELPGEIPMEKDSKAQVTPFVEKPPKQMLSKWRIIAIGGMLCLLLSLLCAFTECCGLFIDHDDY